MTAFPVPTMPAPPVAVVGLGQLGGSLAAALVEAGREVSGWDVDPAAREAAAASRAAGSTSQPVTSRPAATRAAASEPPS